MCRYNNLKIVAVIFIMIAMLNLVVGCNNETPTTTEPSNYDQASARLEIIREVLIDENDGHDQALEENMIDGDVFSAKLWLEEQGYSYVDFNSLVLIEKEYKYVPVGRDIEMDGRPDAQKVYNEDNYIRTLMRSDTVVWSAFENPTHDMANHTALLTHWQNNGEKKTIFLELDISTETPVPIRQGLIIDGVFVPEDVNFESCWGCMLSGLGGSAAACLLSNCGYGACLAGGVTFTSVACAIGTLFE